MSKAALSLPPSVFKNANTRHHNTARFSASLQELVTSASVSTVSTATNPCATLRYNIDREAYVEPHNTVTFSIVFSSSVCRQFLLANADIPAAGFSTISCFYLRLPFPLHPIVTLVIMYYYRQLKARRRMSNHCFDAPPCKQSHDKLKIV
jgi:hypothetical protein